MVEFFDARYPNIIDAPSGKVLTGPLGKFVSRYYIATLLERDKGGLDLRGDQPAWKIASLCMDNVRAYLIDYAASLAEA
jgi:hypothetical protein